MRSESRLRRLIRNGLLAVGLMSASLAVGQVGGFLGESAAEPSAWQRTLPARVELLTPASGADDPHRLFDGDTETAFRWNQAAPARLRVHLAPVPRRLAAVGVYGPADGRLTVWAEQERGPAQLLDLNPRAQGWQRFRLPQPVTVSTLLLEWQPASPGSELREIELWTAESAAAVAADEPAAAAHSAGGPAVVPPGGGSDGVEIAQGSPAVVELAAGAAEAGGAFTVPLPVDPGNASRAFLSYELLGLPHWSAAVRSLNGHPLQGFGATAGAAAAGSEQIEEIDPRWLRRGINRVRFAPARAEAMPETPQAEWRMGRQEAPTPVAYTVRNLRLVVVAETGRTTAAPDGQAEMPWDGSTPLDLALVRPAQPYALEIAVAEPVRGVLAATARTADGELALLSPLDLGALGAGRHLVPLAAELPPATAVRFTWSAPDGGRGAPLAALALLASPVGPRQLRLTVTHPATGDPAADGAYLRGFVDSPPGVTGPPELRINGAAVAEGVAADGALGVLVPRPPGEAGPWDLLLDLSWSDGSRLTRTLRLGERADDGGGPNGAPGHTVERTASPDRPTSLSAGGAKLDVPAGAVDRNVKLTMRAISAGELPALDAGMTNVTPGRGGFRFGPNGQKFRKPLTVTLPFDAALIPKGLTAAEVRTYFFDVAAGHWRTVPRLHLGSSTVVSATTHFTDFINATLVLPDEPSAASFSPNSLQLLAKADPAAEIDLIAPPEGGPAGDAELRHPLTVPPGRLGLQPDLTLTYNSGAANGWLGVGWDLQLPAIEVSTLFGVPRYDPVVESETYLLEGGQLAPVADPANPAPRQAERVFTRRAEEGSFQRIVRHGGDPTSFWWEVTDQHGIRSQFGQSAQARLADPQTGNTFRWLLEHVVDPHGNSVDYTYVQDTGSSGEPWLQVYPAAISYTGVQGSGGFYQVVFTLDDGQQRADRFSTGRPGFKVFTRKRLNRVDVLAGGSLVRSYLLAYQQGDFDKSLLASVAVTGQDGTTVLSQHQFTYQHANAAFGPPETWGGIGGAHDATDSFNLGGSFHVYAGIGPPECIPLVGVQAGGSVSGTTELLSFVDVNGDGLPDRIDNQGHVDLNQQGSFASTSASGVSDIGRTLEFGFDLNAGFRADLEGLLPVTGGFSFVYTHANEDRTLVDINGDGFPDWVAADGSFRTSLNNGTSFSPAASWGGFGAGGLSLGMAGEQQDVLSNLQLANTLRKLVLPFTGPVSLGGAVQKKQAGGDGVTAEIWQNGNQVWQRTFAAADTAPCLPAAGGGCGGGLTLNVQEGDRLYFLSGSIRDTDSDALLWAPQVTYTAGDPAAQEPWGPQVYQFDGGADFRLAGPPAVAWVATADGTAEVQGAIVKQVTSDDVTVTVVQNGNTASPVYQRTFAAAEVGSFAEVPPVGVAAKDKLTFRVSSQTPVDPNLVQWTPQVALGGNQPQAVQPFYDTVARLAPTDQPTVSWPVPASWDQTLHVSWAPGGAAATLYVQAPQSLLSRTALPASATTFDLPVQAATGQPLFVTVLAPDASSLGTLSVTGNGGAVPVNQRYPAPASKEPLSGGWHGWYYGEWNGNKPFSEGGLALPQSQSAGVPDFTPAVPNWQGTTGFALAAWTGSGFDLYQAAEGVKPSRQGGNAAGNLDLAMGTSAGGGLNVVRKTTGKSVGVDVSAGLNLAVSLADNQTEVDLLDMNGDRYPDQVTGSGVRFSNGRDGFGDLQPFPGLNSAVRLTKDANVTTGIGLGTTFSKKSGGGKPKGVVSTMPSVGSTVALSQTRYDLIDVNGDGLPDLVTMGSGATAATVQLNLGYRFGAPETWPLPAWNTGSGGGPGSCTDLVGIAAGGIASLISDRNSPNALNFTRSSALQAGVAIGPFGASASTTLARTLVAMIDVNGDGLPDHVSKEQGEPFFRVKLNHGDGWDPEQLWPVPDWNTTLGDGYVIPGSLQCLDAVSYTGNIASDASLGFQDCLVLVPPVPVVGLDLEITGQVLGSGGGLQLFFQDLDGDGLPDHVLKKPNDPNVYVKRNLATQANLLTAVQRPLGGSFQLSYRRQGNRVGLSDDGSHKVDMPETQWVLASVTVNDGRGNAYTTGYEYFNDAYTDRTERESYGYARVRTTRPDGSTIDRRYQNQDLYQRRLLAHEAIADASGRLFRTEDLAYQLRPLGPGAFFPARVFEQTSFFEGAAGAGKVTSRTWDYDGFGNIISFQDAGDGAAADQVVASTAYFVDPQLYVIQPSQLVVRDGNGALLRQRSATYNAQGDLASLQQVLIGGKDPASGSPYTGNSNAVFSYSYDAFGNMASVADPSGYTRTFAYDPVAKTWPARVTDSFGYSSSFAWNLLYGKVASTVDENGQLEQRTYDLFGRMASVVGPYDSSASPALTFEYFPAASPPLAVVHQKDVTRSATIDSVVFVDGIERTVETKVSAELDQGSGTATSTGMRVSGHLDFDALGRVAGRGQPVFDSGATRSFVAVAARNPTLFAYDVLDRTVQASFPNGAVTRMSYGFGTLDGVQRLAHTRTDPKGRATIFYDDVRGNVRGVQQTNTGATLLTRYAYDALSQLTAVTDARGNATSLQYDTLGRRVLQQNPDSGTTELRYTPAGDLGAKISANLAAHAQQIRYLRTFHRLDGINYPDLPPAVFTYGAPGAPGNTANRLAASSDGSGTEQLTYGRLGEIVQSVRTPVALNGDTPRGPYATRFQFDSFQRLLSLTYPDGEQVTYTFDAGGQVKKATGVVGGAPFDYLHHQGYDEFGDRVRSVYGNGVETRLSYDPLSRELAGIGTTEASGRPIQMLSYQRDLTGTVLGLANSMAQGQGHQLGGPLTETFTYDGLDQLVSAAGSLRTPPNQVSSFTLALAYDALGNLVSKNQLEVDTRGGGNGKGQGESYNWSYAYAGPRPHAPTQVGDQTLGYDLDGNQVEVDSNVNGTRRTLAWDSEDRLAALADNGQTEQFLYESDGTRTNKAGQNGETIYVNRWFSVANGNKLTKHVFADDQRVASRIVPPDKIYFYHADHLGSTQYLTDQTGEAYQHLEYFPQGELWVDDGPQTDVSTFLFTGQELDEETGLSYFGSRYYDPRQGQWISADPLLDGMLDAEGLAAPNLTEKPFHLPGLIYGYAANSPTNLVDLHGLGPLEDRAKEIHLGLPEGRARNSATTAVIELEHPLTFTPHGEKSARTVRYLVSSNAPRLSPGQRDLLNANEAEAFVPGTGIRKHPETNLHAERRGVKAAEAEGAAVKAVGASRPVCSECQEFLEEPAHQHITVETKLKGALSSSSKKRLNATAGAGTTKKPKTSALSLPSWTAPMAPPFADQPLSLTRASCVAPSLSSKASAARCSASSPWTAGCMASWASGMGSAAGSQTKTLGSS